MDALTKRLIDRRQELETICACRETIDTIAARAMKAGVPINRTTVAKYLQGKGAKRPPERTIRGLAAGFDLSPAEIRHLLGMPPGDVGPWIPTEEAAKLSRDQREALDRLIRTIVRDEQELTQPLSKGVERMEDNEKWREVATDQQVLDTERSAQEGRGLGSRRTKHKRKPRAPVHTDEDRRVPPPA